MKMNIIDLFCGCGGLSKGFEMAGFDVVAAIDFWKDAIVTYNNNHINKVAECCDIRKWENDYLKKLNAKNSICGVIGGPPCQGFSTVGTRDINDPRNYLYQEYCRVVENVQPNFFVLENVKGLLTLNNGAFKDDIINRFSNLGYTVRWSVLNAADFGVPQNRYRVFFVGLKNKEFNFPNINENKITTYDALNDLPSLDLNEEIRKYKHKPENDFQKLMRKNSKYVINHDITNHSQKTIDIVSKIPDGGSIKDLPVEYWNVRKYNKAFERMHSSGQSNTVDTGHRNYFHYSENRIPSVRENCRLQSFPDDYVIYGSKTSQYKQVGNAVPPLLAYAIAKEIKGQISNEN